MKRFKADLHIHTCLSPCADDEMVPVNILNMARLMGIEILGICDHNSAKNLGAFEGAREDYGILVLPGIEVQSIEEVHILCYFPDLTTCIAFQDIVYRHLPEAVNRPEIFGNQWIVDKPGNVVDVEKQLLITSVDMSVESIQEQVRKLGGLYIPAHIDKRTFSLYGQLGFMPEGLKPDALEYSRNTDEKTVRQKFKIGDEYTLITSSDAHRLSEMVFPRTYFYMNSPSFNEVRKTLGGFEGRKVIVQE